MTASCVNYDWPARFRLSLSSWNLLELGWENALFAKTVLPVRFVYRSLSASKMNVLRSHPCRTESNAFLHYRTPKVQNWMGCTPPLWRSPTGNSFQQALSYGARTRGSLIKTSKSSPKQRNLLRWQSLVSRYLALTDFPKPDLRKIFRDNTMQGLWIGGKENR